MRKPAHRELMDPVALMEWLAGLPARRRACLECGGGEAAAFLAGRFAQVSALNIVPGHLAQVSPPVQPLCASAAALPFAANSLDLVISVQSLHHFAVEKHLAEARRVLRQGGIFAALCWGEMRLPEAVSAKYKTVFKTLAPFWEKERGQVLAGYANLAFDGREISLPKAQKTSMLSLDALDLTIARWSAAQRAVACGADIPDPEFTAGQRRRLPAFAVSWPLLGRVFCV